ncbi:MAG: aminotransferase class I/II-fold pyridoxal phosphate-dependent enzyme, partial [Sphingobacteriales bacterium]
MNLSTRLTWFAEPETLKMAKLGRELRSQGIDVIDLSLGEPDFDTPQHIKDAAKKAIDDNWSHYPPVAGYPDLREAVCTKLKRDNNLDYKPENIVVSTGAKQSLANAIWAVVSPRDEVVIPTPFWVSYSEIVKMGEGVPVLVRTRLENGYKMTAEEFEKAITAKTRLFMFSSPC